MLQLDFASRGFYFCAYCAAFTRVAILSARGAARFFAERDFLADYTVRFSNCDFMSRWRGMILRVMDFADCGLTSRGFAFVRRVLILSRDAVWRAVRRLIVDYPPHLRAVILFENI